MTLSTRSPRRRRFFAVVLPLCLSLTIACRPAGTLVQAQAQRGERQKAPELDGAVGTLGSDKPITLKDLRGKIVVIEFWTLC